MNAFATRSLPALLVLLLSGGCEPFSDTLDFESTAAPVFRARDVIPPPAETPETLRVMAWNIKYGAGRIDFWFDYHGDRVHMARAEVATNLANLEAVIRAYDPDVLITEEIEVNSKRSAYVDMVQHILDNTDLNWGAYFQSWDSRWIPNEGLGRMDLGIAIFSRYPIREARRIKQKERSDQDALTSYFYIRRVLGRAVIDIGDRDVAVWGVHVEAYDTDGTKQAQIAQLFELLQNEALPWVMGGDLNELPPVCDERVPGDCDGKLQLQDFNDENAPEGDDYEQPPYTPSVLSPWFTSFTPWVPLERYGVGTEAQRPYFTHTTLRPDAVSARDGQPGFWNRTLDYLFVRPTDAWEPDSTGVMQRLGDGPVGRKAPLDPMWLSDHAPVYGTWRVGP
jgi:endonuclease/exonuclease/phosphatase family metal-dependent hydrolase